MTAPVAERLTGRNVAACNHGGVRPFVIVLALFVLAPAALAAEAPPTSGVHHTAAGTAAAKHALLRAGDVGKGWSDGLTPKKVGALTCGSAAKTVAGAIETGSAVSPTFRAGSTGPFVSETTFRYADATGAARFYDHVASSAALSCLAKSVAAGSTKNVTFKVTQSQLLQPPKAGARSAAYRIVGSADSTGQKVRVYVDVVLLLRGAAISELSYSSFLTPMDAALELHVARAAAARL